VTADRIAHYTIRNRLGAGGMGEVYRAHDERLERDVALKVLLPGAVADETARARLLREARTASALNHAHIAHIYEVGESEGRTYIAMELVEGRTLRDATPPEGLPVETAIRYGAQIADALAHAHEKGIVHRDLKSGNIVITPDGRAKVLDFGLAKRMEGGSDDGPAGPASEDLTITKSGVLVGTPAYLAPEALQGAALDARSDLWALGVVLYEMVTGALPFSGRTVLDVSRSIVSDPPAPLPPRVPPGLRSVILRLLAKEPGRRYRGASEVAAALGALAMDSSPTVATGSAHRKKLRLLVAWGSGVVAAALLCIALFESGLLNRWAGGGGGRPFPPSPPGTHAGHPDPGGPPSPASRIRSLAVLPLENLSGDAGQDYFADGMTEELITRLAPIGSLKVISRTSIMRYKGTQKSIPEIARELAVDGIVEGSVLRSGERVRITAQLIDAAEDRHLWAQSYEREMSDVLALQRDVAMDIVNQIQLQITPREHAMMESPRPVNVKAYEQYLTGRFHWNKITDEGVRTSVGYYRQAIAIDPSDPRYYAAIANSYLVLGHLLGTAPIEEASRIVKENARKALDLDSTSAEAHASMGAALLFQDWDFEGADRHLRRSLELNPGLAITNLVYGVFLLIQGRDDEALAHGRRARELDPLSLLVNWSLADELILVGRIEEAREQTQRTLEIDPTSMLARSLMIRIYEETGDYVEAIEAHEGGLPGPMGEKAFVETLRAAYAAGGAEGYLRAHLKVVEEAEKAGHPMPCEKASLYARLGDRDRAFAELERAYARHDRSLLRITREPGFKSLRGDSRLADLLRRIGIPARSS
jgi:TolB-like protein/predicted Ser/Thr protein kinase